jgi:hypothetical protein
MSTWNKQNRQRKRDYVLRGRLEVQIAKGKKPAEAAKMLGITNKHAQRLLAMKKSRPKRDSLNITMWLEFVTGYLNESEQATLFNGRPMKESHSRALYRWREEGSCPRFFSADSFLIDYELHINDFLDFCQERGESPWACGQAPEWEEGDLVDV